MKSLILLKGVQVENANAIAGHTYGFPALTHFLGYTHALSRALQSRLGLTLGGCAIVCHDHQVQSHQPGGWGDHVFALTRNPLTKEGNTAAFIEEGRMQLNVSLVIACDFNEYDLDQTAESKEEAINLFCDSVRELALMRKLAGGTITGLQSVQFHVLPEQFDERSIWMKKFMRRLLPGFLLQDATEQLREHFSTLKKTDENTELLDAWLEFMSYKQISVEKPSTKSGDNTTNVVWERVPSPGAGWCVPLALGYRAISALYKPGEVARTRDQTTPFRFAELAYGLGRWVSPHRFESIEPFIWRYHHENEWYLCQQIQNSITN